MDGGQYIESIKCKSIHIHGVLKRQTDNTSKARFDILISTPNITMTK